MTCTYVSHHSPWSSARASRFPVQLIKSCFFFFKYRPAAERYPLSLHDALPISLSRVRPDGYRLAWVLSIPRAGQRGVAPRSEEHTSELQSRLHLVCRLLLEKKKGMRGRGRRP